MNQYALRLPSELKKELEEQAKKDGRSFNNLLNKILSDYVNTTKKGVKK